MNELIKKNEKDGIWSKRSKNWMIEESKRIVPINHNLEPILRLKNDVHLLSIKAQKTQEQPAKEVTLAP